MINQNSLDAGTCRIRGADLGGIVPLYGSYCFDGVPWSIERILTDAPWVNPGLPNDCLGDVDGINQVVLLFIDGFGWSQWGTGGR